MRELSLEQIASYENTLARNGKPENDRGKDHDVNLIGDDFSYEWPPKALQKATFKKVEIKG